MADAEPARPATPPSLPDGATLLALFTAAYEELRGIAQPLQRTDRIVDDLGLDSLDAYQLVWMVGDMLELPLVDLLGRRLGHIHTVGDVIDALELGAASSAPSASSEEAL